MILHDVHMILALQGKDDTGTPVATFTHEVLSWGEKYLVYAFAINKHLHYYCVNNVPGIS